MNAADALKIIFSHPAVTAGLGGVIGGSGALVYNAFSKPTLDEYGNPIESNDINPLVAAGIGSGVGLVGGMGAKLMTPQSNRSGNVYSQAGRQAPQEVVSEPVTMYPQKMPNPDAEYPYEIYWEQSTPNETTPGNYWDDIANAVDDAAKPKTQAERDAKLFEIVSSQSPQIPEELIPVFEPRTKEELEASLEWIKRNREARAAYQQSQRAERAVAAKQQMQSYGWDFNRNYWDADNVPKKRNMDIGNEVGLPVVGWDAVEPSMLGKSNMVGTNVVRDIYYPNEQYLYSVLDDKQFKDPNKLPRLIQTPARQFQEESITTRLPLANNPVAWNVVSADPDEAARYQKWLESEAIIRGRNQNPQVIGNDLFDAGGNMILDYPEKKIV